MVTIKADLMDEAKAELAEERADEVKEQIKEKLTGLCRPCDKMRL